MTAEVRAFFNEPVTTTTSTTTTTTTPAPNITTTGGSTTKAPSTTSKSEVRVDPTPKDPPFNKTAVLAVLVKAKRECCLVLTFNSFGI